MKREPSSPHLDPYALAGTTFRDRYVVGDLAGVGRYSTVYRATEKDTDRRVALRLLKVRTNLTPSQRTVVVERLRAFVHPLSEIAQRCPTFADVLDVGSLMSAGRWMPAIVQSWLAGETLESALAEERRRGVAPRTLARAIDLLTPVADALGYAHARGVVHGSLSPRNLFVHATSSPRASVPDWSSVEVLDLGLATALASIQAKDRAFAADDAPGPATFFAPAYASPEHFTASTAAVPSVPEVFRSLTPGADVFSLALILVELVTGRAPLGDGDDVQLETVALDPAVRPTPRTRGRDLGGYVESVIERAVAVRAVDRYATVTAFWDALRAASRMTLRPSSSSFTPPIVGDERPAIPEALPARVKTQKSFPAPWEIGTTAAQPPPVPAERPATPIANERPAPAILRDRPAPASARERPAPPSVRERPAPPSVRERPAPPPPSVRVPIPAEEFFLPASPTEHEEPVSSARPSSMPGTNPLFGGDPEASQLVRSVPPTAYDAAAQSPRGRRRKRLILGGVVFGALIAGAGMQRAMAGASSAGSAAEPSPATPSSEGNAALAATAKVAPPPPAPAPPAPTVPTPAPSPAPVATQAPAGPQALASPLPAPSCPRGLIALPTGRKAKPYRCVKARS